MFDVLATTFFFNGDGKSYRETLYCLNKNIENRSIGHILVLLESSVEWCDSLKTIAAHHKVTIKPVSRRPTYKDMFQECNHFVNNGNIIVSNSDIYFPEDENLKRLSSMDFYRKAVLLTRYDILRTLKPQHANQPGYIKNHGGMIIKTRRWDGASIDTWMLKTPIALDNSSYDIYMGTPECDGYMTHELGKNYRCFNPCLDIISIHKHDNWDSSGYHTVRVPEGTFSREEWNSLLQKKGHRRQNIEFCNLSQVLQ